MVDFFISQVCLEAARFLVGVLTNGADFHPDRFYEVYTSTAEEHACHRGQGPAGIYGAESSDCDSPVELVNKTMQWVKDELKDKIDFVIWTGDSARHDNDEEYPRSEDQVVGLNKLMVEKMFEVFGKHNGDENDDDPNNDYVIPIVPNIGNNDILPHNIFRQGPNKWTRTYSKLWRQFIPEVQKHQFEQGGWFYVEVIPNKLAVFSLNTMYFFTSNAAADGCAQPSEPGYHQMEWLRIQLQFMRNRGIKAMLTGHVPPAREDSKTSWDETCWQKYTLWLRQYRDVIVSSHYGHFNYDHFILQDFKDLRKGTKRGKMPDYSIQDAEADDDEVHSAVKTDYFLELRDRWAKLPDPPRSLGWLEELEDELAELRESEHTFLQAKNFLANVLKGRKKKQRKEKKYLEKIGGEFAERYAVSFVAASVVPNLYPTLRVYEYNITGLDDSSEGDVVTPPTLPSHLTSKDGPDFEAQKKRKYRFEIPDPPSMSSPPGPAYSPQTLSLVRYTQYLANITHINNDFQGLSSSTDDELDAAKWKEGKHKGKKPHNKDHTPNPKKFKYEVHYDTRDDDVYKLKDLTMPSIVDLARRIGNFVPDEGIVDAEDEREHEGLRSLENGEVDAEKKHKHSKKKKKHKGKRKHRKRNEAWYTFVRRAFVETLNPTELEEEFGD